MAFYPKLRKIYAFQMKNNLKGYQTPLSNYQVTVDEIERLTGYDFFERLDDEDEVRLESKLKEFNNN
ncbi:MAG: DNA/RNA non-specific endonuclease [Flavobacteriales bacterium]|nr:DNA/RNA non-specific endonuclease [Flavobacteriales bacterium]